MGLTNLFKVPILIGRWCNRAAINLQAAKNIGQQQQQRLKSTRMNCTHLVPKCGDRFKEKPCVSKQQPVILTQPAPKPLPPQKRSVKIKRPELCCGNPCAFAFPRFDALYYKRTDKLNKEYQQTWAECPVLLERPKLICCFEKIKYPKFKKRPRKLRPNTACKQICARTTTKCPRVEAPCSRHARVPPLCNYIRGKADCKKRKTPFPSFSECRRKAPSGLAPIECRCLMTPSTCECWAHYHRMSKVKKIGLC